MLIRLGVKRMQALVYQGPGKYALEDKAKPTLLTAPDAIVRVTKTTICGPTWCWF